jgi:hypothetical protein
MTERPWAMMRHMSRAFALDVGEAEGDDKITVGRDRALHL